MPWILIGIIPPALWGINNFVESYFLKKHLSDKNIGLILILYSIPAVIFLPAIFLFAPTIANLPARDACLIILNGVIGALSLIPYSLALRKNQPSDVIPIFQTIPIFAFLMEFIFLGVAVSGLKLFGSFLIILGSIGISINFQKKQKRFDKSSFFLMLLSSFLMALSSLIFKFFAIESSFSQVLFWDLFGGLLLGIFLFLFSKKIRMQASSFLKKKKESTLSLIFVNEGIALAAEAALNFTALLVPLGIAWSMNGLQPLIVLAYGCILTVLFPKTFKENLKFSFLLRKSAFITSIVTGVFLIYS